jgi:hypothetical protein
MLLALFDDDAIILRLLASYSQWWWLSDLPKSKFICCRFLLLSLSLSLLLGCFCHRLLPPCRKQIPQIFHLDCSDDNFVLALVENYWENRECRSEWEMKKVKNRQSHVISAIFIENLKYVYILSRTHTPNSACHHFISFLFAHSMSL